MAFQKKSKLCFVFLFLANLVLVGSCDDPSSGEEEETARDKRGFDLSSFTSQLISNNPSHSRNPNIKSGFLNEAQEQASKAFRAVANQDHEAWKAASQVVQKIANQASSAAQKAQAAAAAKYQEAATLTRAAQSAQVTTFREAAVAAHTSQTVQAVDALVEWAQQQYDSLAQLLAASEAQLTQAKSVRDQVYKTHQLQSQQAWAAHQIMQQIMFRQAKAIQSLQSTQRAAQQAKSSAQKAISKAKGTANGVAYG